MSQFHDTLHTSANIGTCNSTGLWHKDLVQHSSSTEAEDEASYWRHLDSLLPIYCSSSQHLSAIVPSQMYLVQWWTVCCREATNFGLTWDDPGLLSWYGLFGFAQGQESGDFPVQWTYLAQQKLICCEKASVRPVIPFLWKLHDEWTQFGYCSAKAVCIVTADWKLQLEWRWWSCISDQPLEPQQECQVVPQWGSRTLCRISCLMCTHFCTGDTDHWHYIVVECYILPLIQMLWMSVEQLKQKPQRWLFRLCIFLPNQL